METDINLDEGAGGKVIPTTNDLPEYFEPRCKVCKSQYRHAIERMIALGTAHSEIERTFDGEVPRRSIGVHAKEHLSYEQAAIREIIAHEAAQIHVNYEEGVKGRLLHRTYLSAALKKAWDDLINGNVRIDPAIAIQIIQQMDKFDRETSTAAVDELTLQFDVFKTAVERTVPREMWEEIFRETQILHDQAKQTIGRELEA